MRWVKKGHIFKPDGGVDWMQSHAQIPVPMKLKEQNRLRIYFSTRQNGLTQPAFIETDLDDPSRILHVHKSRLWEHGEIGTFDESGIMPASFVDLGDKVYMYYVGWNIKVKTSYHLAAGIAVSYDQGVSFQKYSQGPILDRSLNDPIWATIPCVRIENDVFRMWYISCTGWKVINGKPEPLYLIKYGESQDGISWRLWDEPVIDYKYDGEALGRPWIIKDGDIYKMWYSTRGTENYRIKNGSHYMLGYAESKDGIKWERHDEDVNIGLSDSGWDSEMLCYCSVYEHNGKKHMLYNGNGFGQSGFGYAVEE